MWLEPDAAQLEADIADEKTGEDLTQPPRWRRATLPALYRAQAEREAKVRRGAQQ
jgi:hypothetical protein